MPREWMCPKQTLQVATGQCTTRPCCGSLAFKSSVNPKRLVSVFLLPRFCCHHMLHDCAGVFSDYIQRLIDRYIYIYVSFEHSFDLWRVCCFKTECSGCSWLISQNKVLPADWQAHTFCQLPQNIPATASSNRLCQVGKKSIGNCTEWWTSCACAMFSSDESDLCHSQSTVEGHLAGTARSRSCEEESRAISVQYPA